MGQDFLDRRYHTAQFDTHIRSIATFVKLQMPKKFCPILKCEYTKKIGQDFMDMLKMYSMVILQRIHEI